MNRRLLEVGKVHRDLRHAAHQESRTFYKAHSTRREPHRLRDLLRNLDVGSVQKHVVSDQEFPSAHHRCAGCWMHARLTEVRSASRIRRNLIANALKLPAPY